MPLHQLYMPLLLLAVVAFSLLAGDLIPSPLETVLYATSLTLKELVIFILPLLVFSFVFSSLLQLSKKAVKFVLMLVAMVCLSNFLATNVAYYLGGSFLYKAHFSKIQQLISPSTLNPAWNWHLPTLLSNDISLMCACLLAFYFIMRAPQLGNKIASKLLTISYFILNRCFIPILPIFVLGFALKLQHDQRLEALFNDYAKILVLIFCLTFAYLMIMYAFLAQSHFEQFRSYLQNMIGPTLTAFSTMSSVAAMPFTMLAAENNCRSLAVARAVVPATVNIHLVGDCFAIPLLALALLLSFGHDMPNITVYTLFTLSFVANKFAVAGVPGGGILVALPILENYLGFTTEMLALITALYMMFDPIITAANVLGNGAFVIAFDRVSEPTTT
jgi:Na+/H+-dicarboxylate symporter